MSLQMIMCLSNILLQKFRINCSYFCIINLKHPHTLEGLTDQRMFSIYCHFQLVGKAIQNDANLIVQTSPFKPKVTKT